MAQKLALYLVVFLYHWVLRLLRRGHITRRVRTDRLPRFISTTPGYKLWNTGSGDYANRKSGNLQTVSDLMVPNAGRNCPSLPPISNFGTYSEPSHHWQASPAARPSCSSRACYNAFKPKTAVSLSPVAPFSAEMVATPLRRPWARPGTSASRHGARTQSLPQGPTLSLYSRRSPQRSSPDATRSDGLYRDPF